MSETEGREKLAELIGDMPIAMFTTLGASGPHTVPMSRQEVEPTAELWFISARDTEHVRALGENPQVVLTFSSRDTWVALTGRGTVVTDQAQLDEMWDTFAEAWLPGGREDGSAVLLRVDVESGEYWDTPGSKVASLLSFAKTKVTGDALEPDHGTV